MAVESRGFTVSLSVSSASDYDSFNLRFHTVWGFRVWGLEFGVQVLCSRCCLPEAQVPKACVIAALGWFRVNGARRRVRLL